MDQISTYVANHVGFQLALLMIATTEGGIKVDNERLAKLWGESKFTIPRSHQI